MTDTDYAYVVHLDGEDDIFIHADKAEISTVGNSPTTVTFTIEGKFAARFVLENILGYSIEEFIKGDE